LVRWNHPTAGVLPPARFIPLAEETGAICQIGEFVLFEACRQLMEWRRDAPSASNLSMAVNVAAAQLEQSTLPDFVRECLDKTGLPPTDLDLEITETAFVDGSPQVLDNFQELRTLGVGLKIDDFGSGYASLDYLCRFPFDAMKIDREFVRRLDDGSDREVVETMIGLAHRLGLHVIAEGIETDKQRKMLEDLGCDCGQGYLFARPMGALAATDYLRSSDSARTQRPQRDTPVT
jgi:EAL domain-containing protein (putative c-di-GMP-specific phosphodiesterase class I)